RLPDVARRTALRSAGPQGGKNHCHPGGQVARMSAVIEATNILCPIGRGSAQVWASARAGIARIGSSHVMDRHFDPIQMGLVPEEALGKLTPDIDVLPLPARARRLLRLAVPAL